jgi:hypothetical protein
MNHESETALDDRPDDYFDIEINNNGTLKDLYEAARGAAEAVNTFEKLKLHGRSYDGEER